VYNNIFKTGSFFENFLLPKKTQTVNKEKLCIALLREKAACKMLVELAT